MTRPYDLFLRFLITKGFDDLLTLNEKLEEIALPKITSQEFDAQHSLVHSKVPKPISDQIVDQKYHGDFLRWMKFLDVSDLWYFEKPFRREEYRYIKLVHDIHQDPRMRCMINALLVKGSLRKDICTDVNAKFSYMLKEEHVEAYEKFYWNPRKMTRKDWRNYLRDTAEYETHILFSALTDDREVMRMKLELASQPNISGNLQYFFTQATERAKEYLRLRNPENDNEARKWIKVSMELADKYAKHRTGDVEDFGKTLQMEFDYVENEFETPDDAIVQEVRSKDKAAAEASDGEAQNE